MPLTSIKTISDGPVSIFHALFGKEQNGVYSCPDIQIYLKKLTEKASHLRDLFDNTQRQSPGNIAFPPIGLNAIFPQSNFTEPFDDATYQTIAQNLEITIQLCEKGENGILTPKKTYPPIPGQQIKSIYFNSTSGNYEALVETHETSELKNTLHGNIYQLKLLMLFLHRGYKQGYQFKLATEMKEAEKFDDLVFEYQKLGDTKPSYFFLQAKHKQDDINKHISLSDLLTKNIKGEFCLIKYLVSYLRIKKNPQFQDSQRAAFFLCTNIDVSPETSQLLQPVSELNNILAATQHRFKKGEFPDKTELYNTLKQGASEMITLAKTLHEQLTTDKKKVTKYSTIIKENYEWLIDNDIIDDKTREFSVNFLHNRNLSADARWFKEIYEKRDQAIALISDIDVDEFLDHLVLAVNQPNEVDLGEIIAEELGDEFHLIDSEFIYADFQKQMLDWMKDRKGTFRSDLSAKSFVSEVNTKLNSLILIGPTLAYQSKLETFGLTFNPLVQVTAFLANTNQSTIIYQTPVNNTLLSSMQVYQTLKNLPAYQKKDSYVFISLKKAIRLQNELIAAFTQRRLLVLICENSPTEDEMEQLLKPLLSNATSARKIIFITPHGQHLREFITSQKLPLIENESITWSSLPEASQTSLKTKNILFQGSEVQLARLSDQFEHIIDADVLTELLTTSITSIGQTLKPTEEKSYIDRTFTQDSVIKYTALSAVQDIFAIANISKDQLASIVGVEHPIRLFNENEPDINKLARHIILDMAKDTASTQFEQLCGTFPLHNIHYLSYNDKKLIWQKSLGDSFRLREYREGPLEFDKLEHFPLILSAEPGMGKSTTLTHIAELFPNNNQSFWFITIALRAREAELETLEFTQLDDVVTFFIPKDSPLEYKLFTHRLKTEGKLFICFDGFDELQEKQQNKVIQLVALLKNSHAKLMITTRKHLQGKLEQTLNTFATNLKPFTKDKVLRYLQDFWAHALQSSGIDQSTIEKKAQKLLELFSSSVSTSADFIGIPLQARLLAEAFVEDIRASIDFPTKLPLPKLYQKFIDAKYQIYCQSKLGLGQTVQALSIQNALTSNLNKTHQQVALAILFPEAFCITEHHDTNLLQAVGIIQAIDGKPNFIHLTFAEYFAALFFVAQLEKPSEHSDHQEANKFLRRYIFRSKNNVIYDLIEKLVEEKGYPPLKKAWNEIIQANIFPNDKKTKSPFPQFTRPKKIHIITEENKGNVIKNYSLPTLPDFTAFPRPTFAEAKKNLFKDIGETLPIYSRPTNNEDWIVHLANTFYYASLQTTNILELNDALKILADMQRNATRKPVRTLVAKNLPQVFKHYIKICITQDEAFDNQLIQAFKKIAHYESKSGKTVYTSIYPDTFDTITALHPLTTKKFLSHTTLIQDLTPEKIIYLSLVPGLNINEALFLAIQDSYAIHNANRRNYSLFFDDIYSDLLIKCAIKYVDEGWRFLTDNKEYDNISKLIFHHSIADYSEINTILKHLLNLFRKAPPSPLNFFLLQSLWDKIIQPLLEKLAANQTTEINQSFLLEMCFYSITYSPLTSLSIKQASLKYLLQLIAITLNHSRLNTKLLAISINLLHDLSVRGLQLVDIGISILVLDPTSTFEYELPLDRHTQITKLLQFKNKTAHTINHQEEKKAFLQECATVLSFPNTSSPLRLKRSLSNQSLGKERNKG